MLTSAQRKKTDLTKSDRYSLYKVGPVLSVSHGMGGPSVSILVLELLKLVKWARCKDPVFVRIGTSGGLGLRPGTVVISDKVYNSYGEESVILPVLGKAVKRPACVSQEVADKLLGKIDFIPCLFCLFVW